MIYKSYLIEENLEILKENVALFYGENIGLKNNFKRSIKENQKLSEISNISQNDILKDEEFFSEVFNISLFNETKIFFINDANDKILELLKKLIPKISNQKIFLFSEILEKKSKLRSYFEKTNTLGIIPCYKDNEISIKKIILNELKDYKGLTNQVIKLIIDNCGMDRIKLDNELNKIKTFFINKDISIDKLELVLNSRINESFDLLKDQALIGNKLKTNRLISDTILEPEKNILYLNLINQRLNKLLEINKLHKNKSLEDAVNSLKPPVFWKDKANVMLQAQKWTKEKIKKILRETYVIELKIKSNSIMDHRYLLKKLIVDICNVANA